MRFTVVARRPPPAPRPSLLRRLDARLPRGPRLQFLNLSILFAAVALTAAYGNALWWVALTVGLGAVLDGLASRWRYGSWRVPWPTMVAALGVSLLLQGESWLPFLLLPVLLVGSKHLLRWRGKHLFNPNNFAATLLLVAGLVRIGINDWGGAPHLLALMLLFGTVVTARVKRLDLALAYLLLGAAAYGALGLALGWSAAAVLALAFSPLQVMLGFFAITDPATSPDGRRAKVAWALLLVLLALPLALAGRVEAPVVALFLGAPLRHAVTRLVGEPPAPVRAPGVRAAAARPRGA